MKKIIHRGYYTVYFDFDVSKFVKKVDTLVLVDDANSKFVNKVGLLCTVRKTSEEMIKDFRNNERAIECTQEDYDYINSKLKEHYWLDDNV